MSDIRIQYPGRSVCLSKTGEPTPLEIELFHFPRTRFSTSQLADAPCSHSDALALALADAGRGKGEDVQEPTEEQDMARSH